MRKYLFIVICTLAIGTSSAKYTQIIYVASSTSSVNTQDGYLVSENDSVRIVYSFWAEKGEMSFMFYNKLNLPLYIDWKSSAFISNGKRAVYFQDKADREYWQLSSGVGSAVANVFQNYIKSSGTASSMMVGGETIVRSERITFIPPKSYIVKTVGPLTGFECYKLANPNLPKKRIKQTEVYQSTPKQNNTIRNYVTYSTTETISNPQYIDNSFKFDKILTMKQRDFTKRDEDSYERYSPWYSPTRFYIQKITSQQLFIDLESFSEDD